MLFNKKNTRKINDKKILHKVGKNWVTISIAMLAMIGGGAAATTGVANKAVNDVAAVAEPAQAHASITKNVKTKAGTVSASAEYDGNTLAPASSASIAFKPATNSNASKTNNESLADIMTSGASVSSATNSVNDGNMTYWGATASGYVNVTSDGTIQQDTNAGKQTTVNYSNASLINDTTTNSVDVFMSGENDSSIASNGSYTVKSGASMTSSGQNIVNSSSVNTTGITYTDGKVTFASASNVGADSIVFSANGTISSANSLTFNSAAASNVVANNVKLENNTDTQIGNNSANITININSLSGDKDGSTNFLSASSGDVVSSANVPDGVTSGSTYYYSPSLSVGNLSVTNNGSLLNASNVAVVYTRHENATAAQTSKYINFTGTADAPNQEYVTGTGYTPATYVPSDDLVAPGNGYQVAGTDGIAGNNQYGTSAKVIGTGNVTVNLVHKDNDTVNFVNNGTIVKTDHFTGADGDTYTIPSTNLPSNWNGQNQITFTNGTHDLTNTNSNVNEGYEALLTFRNPNNVFSGQTLSIKYTGNGAPQDIPTADLTNMSAHSLAIDTAHSSIKSQNDLNRGLKGFTFPNQIIHFDNSHDATGGYSNQGSYNNDVNLAQDYDLQVTFVDEEGNKVTNTNEETVPSYHAATNENGNGYIVDFGQNAPKDNLSLSNLVNNGTIQLPDGYSLSNDSQHYFDFNAASTLRVGRANYKNSISNNGVAHVVIGVTHNQSTQTNNNHAAARFYTADNLGFTHPISDVQNVNTNDSGDIYTDDSVTDVGQRALINGAGYQSANGFIGNTNVKVPAGYIVYNGILGLQDDQYVNNNPAAGYDLQRLAGTNDKVQFEKFNNPALTPILVTPAQEANVSFKDAETGQTVQSSVPLTFGINNSNSNSSNIKGAPLTVIQNYLNKAHYGYVITGYNAHTNLHHTGYQYMNGNSVDGLTYNDKLDTTGADINDNSIHSNKVPNVTISVYKADVPTDHAAVQFQTINGKSIGNPVVVDTGSTYNENQGPRLGAFLAAHNIIPAGYQLGSDDENNQQVNYGETEEPNVTTVRIAPKSADTFEAAIQFRSNGENVGNPVMIDTGANNSYGLQNDFSKFASQYNLAGKVPANYSLADNSGISSVVFDRATGADDNNITYVNITPNDPSYSNNGNSNQPVNPQPTPQIHNVTNDDVNNAAKNDSKLQDALNAFNAKNGNTKANADALINAINANNTLNNANNNLDDIINDIKGAEQNPSDNSNLSNLLSLYNLYMDLVNSGLFNN